jgi:predicted protein tyrosine phosphatase
MNNFLFVCSMNMLRSPTAEHVARLLGYSADSAGTDPTAVRTLTQEQVDRAERVVCMESRHKKFVTKHFVVPDGVTVECWNVPDDYDYCAPELVELLKRKMKS